MIVLGQVSKTIVNDFIIWSLNFFDKLKLIFIFMKNTIYQMFII